MSAHDEREIADLLSEWRKTCGLMGMKFTDIDAAKFIVGAGFSRPAPQPALAQRATGGVRLTDAEVGTIVAAAQNSLVEGETGLSNGDCNRAGWHVGHSLAPTVARIVQAHLSVVEGMLARFTHSDDCSARHPDDRVADEDCDCWRAALRTALGGAA